MTGLGSVSQVSVDAGVLWVGVKAGKELDATGRELDGRSSHTGA